jgi:hypothetical protein
LNHLEVIFLATVRFLCARYYLHQINHTVPKWTHYLPTGSCEITKNGLFYLRRSGQALLQIAW